MTRIVLIRHGEPRRGTGDRSRQDHGLTDTGREQVEAACQHLKFPIDRIITSPLPRARETADIIARHLGLAQPEVLDHVCEVGELEQFADESVDTFLLRAREAMNALIERAGTTLVVTHAGFIMASVRALFEIPTPGTGARLEPRLASLTEWHRRDGIWELAYYNAYGAG